MKNKVKEFEENFKKLVYDNYATETLTKDEIFDTYLKELDFKNLYEIFHYRQAEINSYLQLIFKKGRDVDKTIRVGSNINGVMLSYHYLHEDILLEKNDIKFNSYVTTELWWSEEKGFFSATIYWTDTYIDLQTPVVLTYCRILDDEVLSLPNIEDFFVDIDLMIIEDFAEEFE
ncbi:MAG: hypothetical protein R3Y35_11790 [Clostridia bacterium]